MILLLLAGFHFGCVTAEQSERDADANFRGSQFVSQIPGISLGGAKIVVKDAKVVKGASAAKAVVIRSQAPRSGQDVNQLIAFGVTDVVIFKNETGREVQDEVAMLRQSGIHESRVTHVPFKYRRFPDFAEPCRHTISALRAIRETRRRSDRMVLIHCTAGEDRTGYLAGLVQLLEEAGNIDDVFVSEMCKQGYSGGDSQKPANIVADIDEDLTPVFVRMAYLIKTRRLTWDHLEADDLCVRDPFSSDLSESDKIVYNPARFRCYP